MKKEVIFFFGVFFIFLTCIHGILSEVIFTEIMYDANGTDTNREWIEIYNNGSELTNLTNWKLYEQGVKHGLTLVRGSLLLFPDEYAIIALDAPTFLVEYNKCNSTLFDSSFSLSNSGEELVLWNGTDYLRNITYNVSIGANGNGKSLQFYNNSWRACIPTPGKENNCSEDQIDQININNTNQNNSENKNQINTTPLEEDKEIKINMDWDDEDIISNEEFIITVEASNLDDSNYDIKLWLEEDGKTISENYNKEDDKWKSGTYYVNEVLRGEGDDSIKLKVRLNSKYNNFSGDTKIFCRIRESESSGYIEEEKEDIEILEADNSESDYTDNELNTQTDQLILVSRAISTENIESEVISLDKENSIIYKSKKEYIKQYALLFVVPFAIILIILLILNKKKGYKEYDKEY